MKRIVTLPEAMELASEYVRRDRAAHPAEFDEAVEYYTKRKLCVNLYTGEVRDKDGWISRYVGYNWSGEYERHPAAIYHDFFGGTLRNQAQRLYEARRRKS